MPDGTLADGLLGSAITLIKSGGKKKPKQAHLRRAVSAAYYAVFHALAKTSADSLVGKTKSRRPNKAWVEVYRGLDHGTVKTACEGAGGVAFPKGIKDFADAFLQLQAARHSADYDPMIRLSKVEAIGYVMLAHDAIWALRAVSQNDQIAFATWVLITSKGAMAARRRVRAGKSRDL